MEDLKDFVIYETAEYLTERGIKESSAKLVPKDSVLVSTRATIGAVAVAGVPLTTNQGFKALICRKDVVLPKFMAYFIRSRKDELLRLSSGTTYPEISKANLAKILVPIPSLSVQQEIVERLDEQFKAMEEIRKRKAEAERVMRGIVKGLFEG